MFYVVMVTHFKDVGGVSLPAKVFTDKERAKKYAFARNLERNAACSDFYDVLEVEGENSIS